MAKRPIFIPIDKSPFFKEEIVEFEYFSGFSLSQKQKSVESLHQSYLKNNNNNVLEISTKSQQPLGVSLSAFNLMIETTKDNCKTFSVESAFQSSKVFEGGGPYTDILNKSSKEAKKDSRLKSSGKIIAFKYFNREFNTRPKTYFYNWLYVNALNLHPEHHESLMSYNAFTDIEFNPEKSINCQACAVAIFVSLKRLNLLEKALESKESFLQIVYSEYLVKEENENEQISFL